MQRPASTPIPIPTPTAPRNAERRRIAFCATLVVFLGATTLWGASGAMADDNPTAVPSASPPVEVDANSPGLMLGDGATLGKVRVLDIKSIVEDMGERSAARTRTRTSRSPSRPRSSSARTARN